MKLQPGISIFCDSDLDPDRFMINSGVVAGDDYDIYKDKKYAPHAYKPKPDWRPLTAEEQDLLISPDDHIAFNNNIAVKKLPVKLIQLYEQLDLHKMDTNDEIIQALKDSQEHLELITKEMNTFVFSMVSRDEDLSFHKLTFTKPGLETIAYYPKKSLNEREYIGLHVDKSQEYTEAEFGTTRNRMCINIASEPRELLIINLNLTQILEKLRGVDELKAADIDLNDLAKLFFNYFPDYPVVKIRQNPYEYYIAPTDNFLHDGSTLNKKRPDFTLIYLGYFNLYQDNEVLEEIMTR